MKCPQPQSKADSKSSDSSMCPLWSRRLWSVQMNTGAMHNDLYMREKIKPKECPSSIRKMKSPCSTLCSCPAWCLVRIKIAWRIRARQKAASDLIYYCGHLKRFSEQIQTLFWELFQYIKPGQFSFFFRCVLLLVNTGTGRRADFNWDALMCHKRYISI